MIVFLGLVECKERKTLTGLLRVIGESVSLSGLSRFLSKWPWSTQAEGRPFRSKIDLAVDEIAQFEPVADTHTHVLVDSWYHCKRVRRTARDRGWELSGALKSNRVLWLIHEDGSREWLKLSV